MSQSALAIDLRSIGGSLYIVGRGGGIASDGYNTGSNGGQVGIEKSISEDMSVDAFYFNEGTPYNNHRDGFAVMSWLKKPITNNLTVQAGAGAYLSMNTTTVNSEQKNENKIGAVVGIAALYRVFGSNFYLTSRVTHAQVPGSVNTDTIYVGAGYLYQNAQPINWDEGETDVSILGGQSQTTRENSHFDRAFQIEVRRLRTKDVAYSVSIITEGDSGVTNRSGIAAQVWYVVPTKDDKWTFSVGAGPYIARDQREPEESKYEALGLTSFEVSHKLTKKVDVVFRFNRDISFRNKGQDSFFLGVRGPLKK